MWEWNGHGVGEVLPRLLHPMARTRLEPVLLLLPIAHLAHRAEMPDVFLRMRLLAISFAVFVGFPPRALGEVFDAFCGPNSSFPPTLSPKLTSATGLWTGVNRITCS